jgi:hypothetical protein
MARTAAAAPPKAVHPDVAEVLITAEAIAERIAVLGRCAAPAARPPPPPKCGPTHLCSRRSPRPSPAQDDLRGVRQQAADRRRGAPPPPPRPRPTVRTAAAAHPPPSLAPQTLKGAATFACDLLRAVDPVPTGLEVEYVRASSYGGGTASSGSVALAASTLAKGALAGRHVIVVRAGAAEL